MKKADTIKMILHRMLAENINFMAEYIENGTKESIRKSINYLLERGKKRGDYPIGFSIKFAEDTTQKGVFIFYNYQVALAARAKYDHLKQSVTQE